MNGGRCGKCLSRDELRLRRASQSGVSSHMANVMAKYTCMPSFTNRIPHLEGQEVFGSIKRRADIALGSKGDSPRHGCVNFSRPRINTTSSVFASSNVDVGESIRIVRDEPFVLIFQGLKVQECVCKDGVWRIERCPPLSNTHCFAIQRDSTKHCDARIITKKTIHGKPNPCYDGLWFDLKGSTSICHKFWFCANDLTCCVRGIGRKYYVDRPLVPSTWLVQVGTDLTHFEVTALEEAGFVLCETCKCALWTLFVNEGTNLRNRPVDHEAWPKIHNNKLIQRATIFNLSTL